MAQSVKATSEPGNLPHGESNRGRRFAWALEGTPDSTRVRWPEWSALSIYAALVAFAIPYHEPWVDEAQAWQLARNLSLASLFKTYIRYEGSPGLWHFLLWMMIRIHISYAGLHWICGAIATAAVGLLLFRSPFPRYLKLSLPFTYFLFFQYAVVARNYVLVPFLLFLAAIAWKKSPFWLAPALGLLANASLHAAIISGGLAAVYAIEQFRNRESKSLSHLRKLLACASLLLVFYAFAILDSMAAARSYSFLGSRAIWYLLSASGLFAGVADVPTVDRIHSILDCNGPLVSCAPQTLFSFAGSAFCGLFRCGVSRLVACGPRDPAFDLPALGYLARAWNKQPRT